MSTLKNDSSAAIMIDENEWIQRLSKWWRPILYAILALVVVLFAVYRFMPTQTSINEDYLNAKIGLNTLRSGGEEAPQALENLSHLLKKSPRLKTLYNGQIAQHLSLERNWTGAKPFASEALEGSLNESSPYNTFSKATFLINDKKYQEALEQSIKLKETLDVKSFPLLYGYNLLRIISLQQILLLPQEESETWNEWQAYANNPSNAEAVSSLQETFHEGKSTLNNFIKEREKALKD